MRRRLACLLLLLLCLLSAGPAGRAVAEPQPPAQPWRIVIASIDVDSPVQAVGFIRRGNELEWGTSGHAVAWQIGTAVPGQPGNAVFSGHNASRGSGVFKRLYEVAVGDRVALHMGETTLEYEVTERHIMRELLAGEQMRRRNALWAGPFPDERITLITCHPTWTNTHRLVVVAKPIRPAVPPLPRGLVAVLDALPQELSPIPAIWPDVFQPVSPALLHP